MQNLFKKNNIIKITNELNIVLQKNFPGKIIDDTLPLNYVVTMLGHLIGDYLASPCPCPENHTKTFAKWLEEIISIKRKGNMQ